MASLANMTVREKKLGGVGVAAVLVLALYWYFLYKPKAQELNATQIHVDSLDRKNQQAKADIATGSLQKLRAQSAEYEQSLKVMRQLVPRSNEVPALLEDISTAARRVEMSSSRAGTSLLLGTSWRITLRLCSYSADCARSFCKLPVAMSAFAC